MVNHHFTNVSAVLLSVKLLVLTALWLVATPGFSAPILVNTSAGSFEVDVLPLDSFDDLKETLDDQVWWDDQALAREFANAVGDSLGLLNFPFQSSPVNGPLFATGGPNTSGNSVGCWWSSSANGVVCSPFAATNTDVYHAFATAVTTPTSVPTASTWGLGLMGLALAGLGWRKLR
jgi:hypothetical protein